MTLGETIYRLRKEKNLSQGDLADALDVSRQSVSKWETDTSVPELDKLVKLSELFGVSLDELVKGRPFPAKENADSPSPLPEETPAPVPKNHKTTGTILLCTGAVLILLVMFLYGDILSGLVLASPFVLCGLICRLVTKRVGLWCFWAVYFAVDAYLHYATSIRLRVILYPAGYSLLGVLFSWAWLVVSVVLLVCTCVSFRDFRCGGKKRTILTMGISFGSAAAVKLIENGYWRYLAAQGIYSQSRFSAAGILRFVSGWLCFAALTVVLVHGIALVRGVREKRK